LVQNTRRPGACPAFVSLSRKRSEDFAEHAPDRAQTKTNLSDVSWENFGSLTSGTSLLVAPKNTAAFYRIVGQ
jgi:hypothetical protein